MCFSAEVELDLKIIEKQFNAKVDKQAFAQYQFLKGYEKSVGPEEIKRILGLSRKPKASQFQWADKITGRIFPKYFAPVIIMENETRKIVPMRYRVRPRHMPKEIPSKYNVFNARLDSLTSRQTWKPIFGRKHIIFPFIKFFEWVEPNGNKQLITFTPDQRDYMWAPGLYDTWTSQCGEVSFSSFAIITDDPPKEVAEQGHDRCPIFLKENLIDIWLTPKQASIGQLQDLLKEKETVHYRHSFDVAA